MLSGRSTTWARNPRRYMRALQADIKKTYPQLGEVAVDYAWAGTLGNTVHRMPQIGELGSGVWLASGFGGHGLNTTAMAGNLIARAIVEGDQTWRQFSPFELVWAGGVAGRVAIQMRVLDQAVPRSHRRAPCPRPRNRAPAGARSRTFGAGGGAAQEAAAQAEAAQQNAVAEETPRYAEPEPVIAAEAEPLGRPAAGRHRSRRRKRRERSEGVS